MRVLFVDYWTKGIHNFTRLVAASQVQVEYVLFHLGSHLDANTPRLELIDHIPCVDVGAFRGLSLRDIVRSLAPDVVVALNIAGLFDRAVCLTCRSFGIPLVFVQHGVWAENKEFAALCEAMDRKRGLGDRFHAFPKFLRMIPWYAQECRRGLLSPNLWKVVFQVARTPAVSRYFPVLADETWPTLACVFADVYRDMLIANVRMPRERIVVTGNPELDPAAFRRDHPRCSEQISETLRGIGLVPGSPVACFAEEAFVEQGLFGWTDTYRQHTIEEIYHTCRSVGVQVLVRPHPAMSAGATEGILRAFSGRPGIAITRLPSLVDTFECSDVVLGTISTALETAIILEKPILTPLWHIAGDAAFSTYLRYGAAVPIAAPSELQAAIDRTIREKEVTDITQFVTRRLGPVDGRAASRIIEAILRIAPERNSSQFAISAAAVH